jgi:membrane protein implicated in regulation of membrane protease activity
MHIQKQERQHRQTVSVGCQAFMLVGFVVFITGIFSFGYALLASFLLPYQSEIVIIALVGLFAAFLGRTILRRGRRLAEVSVI